MKQILSIVTAAVLVTACNSKKDTAAEKAAVIAAYQDSIRKAADTAGLADFQNWKAQNELSDAQQYNTTQYTAAAPVVQQGVRSSGNAGRSTASRSGTTRSVSNSNGNMNTQSSNTAMKKKGWSKAAKGAAIGTAGGAVVGAVVNKKNRVAGGVVGGVIGAGVGYGVGRSKDKKDGRY